MRLGPHGECLLDSRYHRIGYHSHEASPSVQENE